MHYFQLTKTGRFEYGCGEYKVIPVAIGARVTCLRCNYGIVKELVDAVWVKRTMTDNEIEEANTKRKNDLEKDI